MPTKREREAKKYPQSEGNLALADEGLDVLHKPKAKTLSPVLRLIANNREEASDADALTPATGMMVKVGLSMMLWGLIFLAWYWIRLSL